MMKTLRDKIIEALISSKNIKKEDIAACLKFQKEKGVSLDRVLVERGLIGEQELLMLLVKELNIPTIKLSKYKIDPELKEIIPERIARQYTLIPISKLAKTITIAIADPLNIFAVDDLRSITGRDIDVTMSTESEILYAIDNFYGSKGSQSVNEVSKDIDAQTLEIVGIQETEDATNVVAEEGEQAPIIKIVDLIIKEAIKQRASDIHLEPEVDDLRVRYRIDGILQDILNLPKVNQNAVLTRIKIMARLDITETRLPQDGRFKMRIAGREVDFRVSILPTTFGQKVVMRILDKESLSIGLDGLGFSTDDVEKFQDAITKPFGMILVTGPTGSGKSTTLYSIVNQLNTVDKNIITVEDPVEYLIEGLTQIQARPEIGLSFASGLRSILRQSPDIVMVGEIRDAETADIAIKASLTGQLVFSTLHTNDAAGALTRLVDMGVEPFLVASSLVMVCAQRLCRRICLKCKEPVEIHSEVLKSLGYKGKGKEDFSQGKGCEACRQTGYKGRMGILEVMDIDDTIREMLIKGQASDDIKEYAIKNNQMTTLHDDALRKMAAGLTTAQEVLRVTSDS